MSGVVFVLVVLVVLVLVPLPFYEIGKRRGVKSPGVAFIPVFGPGIVLMWSIERSGWLSLIGFIPLIGIVWSIWAAVTVPAEHGRTRWWALAFIFLPLIGHYWYAYTLENVGAGERVPAAI